MSDITWLFRAMQEKGIELTPERKPFVTVAQPPSVRIDFSRLTAEEKATFFALLEKCLVDPDEAS